MNGRKRCATVRKTEKGSVEEFRKCQVGKPWIPKLKQIEIWESDTFEMEEWKETVFGEKDGGMIRVLHQCAELCGRLKDGSSLPVVFKKFSEIRTNIGASKAGFFDPLNRAEEAGLCVRIKAHGRGGRRKLLLLKRPGESPLHAVARAKGTAEKWEQEVGGRDIGWVIQALKRELKQQLARATAEMPEGRGQKRASFFVGESRSQRLESRCSVSEQQTSKVCERDILSINKDQKVSVERKESETKAAEAADNPPPSQSTSTRNIMDTEFEAWLRDVLARFDDELTDETLAEAASWIKEICGDSRKVRRVLFSKALRLDADGYPGQKILSFILEDAEDIAQRVSSAKMDNVSGANKNGGETEEKEREAKQNWEYADQECVEGWSEVIERLEGKVTESTFRQHLKRLKGVRYGRQLVVTAKETFTRAWVHNEFQDLVEEAIGSVESFEELEIVWDVESEESSRSRPEG